jgi:hypothetical protein
MPKNPTLPNDDKGIAITAVVHPEKNKRLLVNGRFAVLCGENGVPEHAPQTLKHVVLVVTRYGNYQALTPFKETVVFEDDVRVRGDCCSATFMINVMDHIAFDGKGDYYILCSLGTHLSNIVKVTIE